MIENKRKISALAPYKIEDDLVFIFLQKRDKNASRHPGFFGFFGGGAHDNETPTETLLRETKEELDFAPESFNHFGKYDLPEIIMDLFITKVGNDFEDKIKILEGEYGKWFSEEDFERERQFITGDLRILEELYEKIQNMNNWQELLKIAYIEAQKSTNISTQNAAILIDDKENIILSEVNSFPNGVKETEERQNDKTARYKYSVHAERNVIYSAAKLGIKTEGLTMVCPWATCSECSQAIIQAGIKRLVTHKQALDKSGHWQEDIEFAFNMLREAGVEIIIFDGKMGIGKILRSGEHWEP